MRAIGIIIACLFLGACAQQMHNVRGASKAFQQEKPKSILVVPVVNDSVDVDAPNYFLATISEPIAERGYYVFPVNLVKNVMDDNGMADANMVRKADPTVLAKLFGADAVLYITIDKWTAQYAVLTTSVLVEFDYVLKSGKTGAELWASHRSMQYTPQSTNTGSLLGNLISSIVTAAIAKADPNYIPLAEQANQGAVLDKKTGLPVGPYRLKQAASKSGKD